MFILLPMSFTGKAGLVNLKNFTILRIVYVNTPSVIRSDNAKIICFVILIFRRPGLALAFIFNDSYFFISFTAVTSFGRTFIASPIIPYCAASNIGASLSVFIATIYFDELIPARCWVAPEIPTAI
jgi:hypothetical protein